LVKSTVSGLKLTTGVPSCQGVPNVVYRPLQAKEGTMLIESVMAKA